MDNTLYRAMLRTELDKIYHQNTLVTLAHDFAKRRFIFPNIDVKHAEEALDCVCKFVVGKSTHNECENYYNKICGCGFGTSANVAARVAILSALQSTGPHSIYFVRDCVRRAAENSAWATAHCFSGEMEWQLNHIINLAKSWDGSQRSHCLLPSKTANV